jgi:DNA-binding MarR family transcriptional regulator
MIEREVAEDDQRVKLLRLTEKGIKRYHALVPRVLDWERELIDALDVSEYRDLLFILDKLGRRLRDMHQRSEVAVGRAGMEEHTEGAA